MTNGQAVIVTDSATVTATNNIGFDMSQLNKLISEVQSATTSFSREEQETVSECLEVIKTEASEEKPKKSMIKTAIKTLNSVKDIAEFGAAVAALVEFLGPLL